MNTILLIKHTISELISTRLLLIFALLVFPTFANAATVTISGDAGLPNLALRALVNGNQERFTVSDTGGVYSFVLNNINVNDLILIHSNTTSIGSNERAVIIKSDAINKANINLVESYLRVHNFTNQPLTNIQIDSAVDSDPDIRVVNDGGGSRLVSDANIKILDGNYSPNGDTVVNNKTTGRGIFSVDSVSGTAFLSLAANKLYVKHLTVEPGNTDLTQGTLIFETSADGLLYHSSALDVFNIIIRDITPDFVPVTVRFAGQFGATNKTNILNNLTINGISPNDYVALDGNDLNTSRHIINFKNNSSFTYTGSSMTGEYLEAQDNSTNIILPIDPLGFQETTSCTTLNWLPGTPPACLPFDYSISTGGNISVLQGNSITTPITANLISGSGQTVTFSASGLPVGATATFNPTSCTTTCTSVMTVSTTGSTPIGTSTITTTGVSTSGLTKANTFNLTVVSGFDFRINTGGSRTVQAGSSTTNTATVTLVSGFAQNVNLSATGLPAGATITFNPTGCLPNCIATMNIFTTTTTSPGTYLVTVSGSYAGISRNRSFYLTVTAAPFDFSLANAGNRSVVQGATTTNTITSTIISGNTEPVNFTTTGLPVGATAIYTPTSCSPTCSTTMNISTTPSTPIGVYNVIVTGTARTLNRSTQFSLTVSAAAILPAPSTPDMTALTDLGPSNTDNITSDRTPDFYVTCISGNTVFIYAGATQIASGVCSGANNITLTSSLFSFGAKSITARQRTPVGVLSGASAALSVTIDGSYNIRWSSSGATSCIFNGFSYGGNPSTSGTVVVTPLVTTTYTVTCNNFSGSTSKNITITVL